MGLVTEVKKEDIFKRKTSVLSPWADPNFNKVDNLGGEPGFKVDDIPERLGLIQQGQAVSPASSIYFSDLRDAPNNYGTKLQFLQTDGKGKLDWAWPFWSKSGSTVYYKSGKVAIGHAAAQTIFHISKGEQTIASRISCKISPWQQWECLDSDYGFAWGIAADNKKFHLHYDTPIGTVSVHGICFDALNSRVGILQDSPAYPFDVGGNSRIQGTLTLASGTSVNKFSIDGTMAGDSDNALPTEKAVVSYIKSFHELTNEPTGFENRADSKLSWGGTRRLTIAPDNGSFDFYQEGTKYTKSSSENIQIENTSGVHFIYYDAGTLTVSVNPSNSTIDTIFETKPLVALIYWNVTDGTAYFLGDERHGLQMDGVTHRLMHNTEGATWGSGLTLSGYTLNTGSDVALNFEVTDGEFFDQDITHAITDGTYTNQYEQQLSGGDAVVPILYRSGDPGHWKEDAASTLPYKSLGAGRLAYNSLAGSTWGQTEVTDNKFMSVTLVATHDWQYPIKMIQGQNEYTDKKTAVEEALSEILSFGNLPTPEMTFLYRLVMQTKDTFGGTKKAKIVDVTDLRGSLVTGSTAVAVDHGVLSGLADIDHKWAATKTTAAWSKSIGGGGDYADWATMIAAMPDLIAHAVTVTIEAGTTLTEICDIKNKHGILSAGVITIQAEKYYPVAAAIPTADSATATTLRDAALAAEAYGNDYFNDCWILIVDGTGTDNGFVTITDYVDATGDVVVAAWPGTQPDNTSRYIIVGAMIDCASARAYGFEIKESDIFIKLYGIGIKDATGDGGVYVINCTNIEMLSDGIYNCEKNGIYARGNNYVFLRYNGIVGNNTDNNASYAGISSEANLFLHSRQNGISDNNQKGHYVYHTGLALINACFGDGNGNWGTYAEFSGQARMAGVECSGAAGNHSDPGTAGNANADQAAAY